MEKLVGLISSIELAIRYMLSGIAIYVIYLLGLSDTSLHLKWIGEQPLLIMFVTTAIGFAAYSLYRITFWIVGDGIAWLLRLSAPTLDREKCQLLYHGPYAKFVRWRHNDGFDKSLSGYLHYRWAVVHYTFIVAFALVFALVNKEKNSVIDSWFWYAAATAGICLLTATWQSSLLFRLERELYGLIRETPPQRSQIGDPTPNATET